MTGIMSEARLDRAEQPRRCQLGEMPICLHPDPERSTLVDNMAASLTRSDGSSAESPHVPQARHPLSKLALLVSQAQP